MDREEVLERARQAKVLALEEAGREAEVWDLLENASAQIAEPGNPIREGYPVLNRSALTVVRPWSGPKRDHHEDSLCIW